MNCTGLPTTLDYESPWGLLLTEAKDVAGGTEDDRFTEYKYGDANEKTQQTKKTVKLYTDGSGGTLEQTAYDYNLQGRMATVTIDANGDGLADTQLEYEYNDHGIRTAQTKTTDGNADGDFVDPEDTSERTDYLVDEHNPTGYAQVLEEPRVAVSIEDEVKSLAREAAKRPWALLPAGVGDDAINSFHLRTQLAVPQAFREWLKFTSGPTLTSGFLFGIDTGNRSTDIEAHYIGPFRQWLTRGWILVGGDGSGNHYVLATQKDDGPGNPVFFVEGIEPMRPAYVVASDLWHFLRFYLRSELGDEGWPFDETKVLAEDPDLAHYTTVPRPWEADD